MKFYIKVCADQTVALMAENGQTLGRFTSVKEALQICEEQYLPDSAKSVQNIRVYSHDPDNYTQEYAIAI